MSVTLHVDLEGSNAMSKLSYTHITPSDAIKTATSSARSNTLAQFAGRVVSLAGRRLR